MINKELTGKIIEIFYRVYDNLGFGFLERVYENALAIEFKREGLRFGQQVPIEVCYREEVVGKYFADFIVEEKIVVEVKADKFLGGDREKQLINYLKATENEVGLLLGFCKKAEFKSKVFEKARNGKIGTRTNADDADTTMERGKEDRSPL